MDKSVLPTVYSRLKHLRFQFFFFICVASVSFFLVAQLGSTMPTLTLHKRRPKNAAAIISRCRKLTAQAGTPAGFHHRTHSDRFEKETRPILIRNAKIWTGNKNGTEVIHADILLDKGIIKSIGHLRGVSIETYGKELAIVDAKGAWVTPGLIDVHSHIGIESLPALNGASDVNSFNGIVQPWLRSLDGLNTHDDSYPFSVAGGVTTSLVLPGSANAIGESRRSFVHTDSWKSPTGGQGFVIKLRETKEKSPSSMVLEPPFHINTSFPNPNLPLRWRHIK